MYCGRNIKCVGKLSKPIVFIFGVGLSQVNLWRVVQVEMKRCVAL